MTTDTFHLPLAKWQRALAALSAAAALGGCGQDAGNAGTDKKLALANQRIAVLEAQLAEAKGGSKGSSAAAAVTPAAAPSVATAVGEDGGQWRYDVTEEKMTGGKRHVAAVESSNTVEFGFPYSGTQHGHLMLRTDTDGKDVMFRIEKGQILCTSYDGCAVQVRFDDDKPVSYSASGPADHSSTLVFLEGYDRFLIGLRKAKRVRIAVNMYQQGAPVFEFDVSGFDMDKYRPK